MPMQVQESWLETPTMLWNHISLVLGAIFMCYGDEKGGLKVRGVVGGEYFCSHVHNCPAPI